MAFFVSSFINPNWREVINTGLLTYILILGTVNFPHVHKTVNTLCQGKDTTKQ